MPPRRQRNCWSFSSSEPTFRLESPQRTMISAWPNGRETERSIPCETQRCHESRHSDAVQGKCNPADSQPGQVRLPRTCSESHHISSQMHIQYMSANTGPISPVNSPGSSLVCFLFLHRRKCLSRPATATATEDRLVSVQGSSVLRLSYRLSLPTRT